MPKSKVGVTLRIEVRDDKGRVVKVIETPSRSFTQNFATLLFASLWSMYSISRWNITYTVYDVMGSPIYIAEGGFLYDVGYLFYSEPQFILSPYQSYIIYMPGIWPGAAFCPEPVYAYGPCSPISTSILSPSLFSFPSSPVYTASGWQLTYSQTWTNILSTPVIVSSVALVFGASGDPIAPGYLALAFGTSGPGYYILYAAIVDNVTPAVVIDPGYSVTFTYTLLYAV
jgi:hypothetical protein